MDVTPLVELPDDIFLEAALKDANIPALLMAIIHLTGDETILSGTIRPKAGGLLDQSGGISEQDAAIIRERALQLIKAFYHSGHKLSPMPSRPQLTKMMSFAAGEVIPSEYEELMLTFLDREPSRTIQRVWDAPPDPAALAKHNVIIIGGGESGICAAIRLQLAGIPYVLIEKNDSLGGTWYENSYPGCRVDSPNHFYCYTFEPNNDWPEYYSPQPVLHKYLNDCGEKYGIKPHVLFNREVVSARYEEESAEWIVTARSSDGVVAEYKAAVVISAVGQLNRPKKPEIAGLETFGGRVIHSASWDKDYDLRGRRIATIGSGASGMQLVPAIAEQAEHVTIFQREATWIIGNPFYKRTVTAGKKWLMNNIPYYAEWYRLLLCWMVADKIRPAIFSDPNWPDQSLSINQTSEKFRLQLMKYIDEQVGDDPELLAKLTPKFPPFGKRILVDAGWYKTLRAPNAKLVMETINHVEPRGIVTSDGVLHEVDTIVCATGFHANKFLWPMEITGLGGVTLGEFWGDDPCAYLGMAMPGFPNFFCLYGPNTNSGQGGSIFFNSECQMHYILECLKKMVSDQLSAIELREEAFAAYSDRLQESLKTSVWAHPAVHSWYKNAKGRVTANMPWSLVDYFSLTRSPNFDEFILTPEKPCEQEGRLAAAN